MNVPGVEIPGWAVALLIPFLSGIVLAIIDLYKKSNANEKAIAINTSNDGAVGQIMTDIKTQITELRTEMTRQVSEVKHEMVTKTDKIENKVDQLFISAFSKQ